MAIEETLSELAKAIKEMNRLLKNIQDKAKTSPEKAEPSGDPEQETEHPGLEDVRSSLIQLKESKDHKTAKSVLKSFGVQKVQDLPIKDYRRCIDMCQKEAA